jgi:DNA polymerase V
MREHVWKRVGVPVTVGIARFKTLAKLISDTAKPFGALAVIDRDRER